MEHNREQCSHCLPAIGQPASWYFWWWVDPVRPGLMWWRMETLASQLVFRDGYQLMGFPLGQEIKVENKVERRLNLRSRTTDQKKLVLSKNQWCRLQRQVNYKKPLGVGWPTRLLSCRTRMRASRSKYPRTTKQRKYFYVINSWAVFLGCRSYFREDIWRQA